jgi:hypothetical protein
MKRVSVVMIFVALLSMMLGITVRAAVYDNLPVTGATYVGSDGADTINAVDIAPDGTVLLAGDFPGYSGTVTPVNLLGGGSGAILRLSANGQALLSVTHISSAVNDMEISDSAALVVCGAFGVAVLDGTANTMMWNAVPGGTVDRCAVGDDGTVAALVKSSRTIYIYTNNGADVVSYESGAGNRSFSDVAVDADSGTVIETGYQQKDANLKVAFLIGRDFSGAEKWTNYDFGGDAVFAANLGADSEGRRVAIGRDGKLYFAGWVDGGNAIYGRNPRDISQSLSSNQLIKTDNYNNPFNISGAKSLAWYGRFEPGSGDLDKGQFLLTRLSDGKGNSIAVYGITADENGQVYLSGEAYATIQNRDSQKVAGITVGGYSGGEAFMLAVTPDLTQRLFWTPFTAPGKSAGGSPAYGIATRNGYTAVGVTLKLDNGQRLITANAFQNDVGGGAGEGYVAVWPNDVTAPTKPILISPADGSTAETHAPLFVWQGTDAERYKLTIKDAAKNKLFKAWLNAAEVCTGADCSYSVGAQGVRFDNGSGYTWKIVAENSLTKVKSDKATFAVEFPGKPLLLEPVSGATMSAYPTFAWNEVDAANEYMVIIKHKKKDIKVKSGWLSAGSCSSGVCTYSPSDPLVKGTYIWKVKARQSGIANQSKSDKIEFNVATDARFTNSTEALSLP